APDALLPPVEPPVSPGDGLFELHAVAAQKPTRPTTPSKNDFIRPLLVDRPPFSDPRSNAPDTTHALTTAPRCVEIRLWPHGHFAGPGPTDDQDGRGPHRVGHRGHARHRRNHRQKGTRRRPWQRDENRAASASTDPERKRA